MNHGGCDSYGSEKKSEADLGADDGDGNVATRLDIFDSMFPLCGPEMDLYIYVLDCVPNPSSRVKLRAESKF